MENDIMSVEEIRDRVLSLAEERGLSSYELCKRANLNTSVVSNMIHRDTLPNLITLTKLCKALDISLSDFFTYRSDVPKDDIGFLSNKERAIVKECRKMKSEKKVDHLLIYACGMNGFTENDSEE